MKKVTMALAAAGIALSCISMGVQAADGTAAGDPGRDWRIALYNAEKKASLTRTRTSTSPPRKRQMWNPIRMLYRKLM